MKTPLLQSLLLASIAFWLGITAIHASDAPSPVGLWKGDDATFEMYESDGKLNARIVALRDPKTSEGKEKTDIHNPDPTKRGHPIIGLVFISGFSKKSDTRWENGTIYDPNNGNSYSCLMDLQGPNKIQVRGFVGIVSMGRNYIWIRAN